MERTTDNIKIIKANDGKEGKFTVRLHYGGIMTNPPGRNYIGGLVVGIDVDPNYWSKIEIDDFVDNTLKMESKICSYYYLKPGMDMDSGLVELMSDGSANEMADVGNKQGLVDLYVVHYSVTSKDCRSEESERVFGNDKFETEVVKSGVAIENDPVIESQTNFVGKVVQCGSTMIFRDATSSDEEETLPHIKDKTTQQRRDEMKRKEVAKGKRKVTTNAKGVRRKSAKKEKGNEEVEEETQEGYERAKTFYDSDYDVNDDDDLDEIVKAHADEWEKILHQKESPLKENLKGNLEGGFDYKDDDDPIDVDSDVLPSDSPDSGSDSDGKTKKKYRRYNKKTDFDDPKWELGLVFATKSEFRELISHQGVLKGKQLRFSKNDGRRCTAWCRAGWKSRKDDNSKKKKWERAGNACPWTVTINVRKKEEYWQVTSLRDKHTCGGMNFNHGCASAKYISTRFQEDIRIVPSITVGQLVEKVHVGLKITVGRQKVGRAKKMALERIEGDMVGQYKRMHDYRAELLRTNPGSNVVLDTDRLPDGNDRFNAIYVCFDACKRGFTEACRPLVGLDGCFLKGPTKGILMTAIGMDPNDQIYPIAYAVVLGENENTWKWFIKNLKSDLNIYDSSKWTFMTDKQKGLVKAIRECFPYAEHRMCVWHLHNNFKKDFKSPVLKDQLFDAAKASYPQLHEREMEILKVLEPKAIKWLEMHTRKPSWTRAYFECHSKCDILVNNMSECFNRVMLFARDKPLYTLLEAVKMYLMERLHNKRQFVATLSDRFGPKIRRKLEKNKDFSGQSLVREAGAWIFQVNTIEQEQLVVNLRERTCSCRRWMLNAIPCSHAIACIEKIGKNVDDFVHMYYSKEMYAKAYQYIIYPTEGPEMWDRTAEKDVVPPVEIRLAGRPKKARRKTNDELKEIRSKKNGLIMMSRSGTMNDYVCRICKQVGHNKRLCPTLISNGSEPPTKRDRNCNGEDVPTTHASKKVKRTVTCKACGGQGHYRSTCTSKVSDMYPEKTKANAD